MSMALVLMVEDLKKRVEALERGQAATRAPLQEGNARRKAEAARLRQMIRATGETDAKRVLQALSRAGLDPLPKARTVDWHLAAIRKTDGIA